MTNEADLLVLARFCGPASSGNGGYTAGLLAERLTEDPHRTAGCPVVEVTLRRPPPLDTAMVVEHEPDGTTRLRHGADLVAEARCTEDDLPTLEEVDPERAGAAMASYPGHRSHPFPRCFACGPDRAEGDGLRIFPGPVGPDRVASLWVPDQSLAEASDLLDRGVPRVGTATAWAALDCVGGWSTDLEGRPMVLGRIAARVDALPVVGETHVVVGEALASEGRKTFTASTIYDSDHRVVARARHTWVAVDPTAFS
ncbi:MAG: hypothetical protein ACRDPR_23825 [Nocardioidaceae bacterium]